MTKIRLILADDHPLIREGFISLLNKNERFEIVGIAENGKELIELAGKQMPDIILSDISMPVMNGIDAIAQIGNLYPSIKSVVLTMHEEREYIINALKISNKTDFFRGGFDYHPRGLVLTATSSLLGPSGHQ